MKNFKLLKAILVFVIGLAISGTVAANEAGKALRVKGKVAVTGTQSAAIKRGAKIFQKDMVETKAGAMAQFRMVDGALFSLRENTQWKVASYEYKKTGASNGNAKLELLKGGLRTITGEIGRKNKKNYELKTPVASIGIRGTHFQVDILDNKLYVSVNEGAVSISAAQCSENLNSTQGGLVVTAAGACQFLPKRPAFQASGHSQETSVVDVEQDELDSDSYSSLYEEEEDPLLNGPRLCEDHVCNEPEAIEALLDIDLIFGP